MTINDRIEAFLRGNGVSDDELVHYGVPGMKWGVRRGTTGTSLGAIVKRRAEKRAASSSEEHLNTRAAIKKGRHQLTNKELQDTITRLNLEQQYDRLSPSAKAKAAKTTSRILGQVGNTILSTAIQTSVKIGANAVLDAAGFDSKGRKKD